MKGEKLFQNIDRKKEKRFMVLTQGFTLGNFYKILYHGMNVYH